MSRQTLASILFWSIASISVLLLAFLVLVIGGVVPIDSPGDGSANVPEAAAPAPPPATPTEASTESTAPAETRPKPAKTSTLVVMTASRGDSWFSARVGSEDGRLLDERILARGETATLRGPRIWLSVGASGNVDVTVDGEPTTLPPGTVTVVLTASRTDPARS
jgi:hypothetical protein